MIFANAALGCSIGSVFSIISLSHSLSLSLCFSKVYNLMRLTMILPVTSLSGSCDKEKSGILGYSVQRKRSGLEPKKKKKKMLRDIADIGI